MIRAIQILLRQSVKAGFLVTMPQLVGCTGSSGPAFEGTLVPVSGVVTINGAPRAGVSLTFMPQPGTPGTGGLATTDEEGRFVATHRTGQEGLEAGDYKVLFSYITKADGSPLGPEEDAATLGTEQLAHYQALDSKLVPTANVPAGGAELTFDLKARK